MAELPTGPGLFGATITGRRRCPPLTFCWVEVHGEWKRGQIDMWLCDEHGWWGYVKHFGRGQREEWAHQSRLRDTPPGS